MRVTVCMQHMRVTVCICSTCVCLCVFAAHACACVCGPPPKMNHYFVLAGEAMEALVEAVQRASAMDQEQGAPDPELQVRF